MDQATVWLIVIFCVVLACYIFVRSRRLSKKNKK
jgi:preprotein translocase subunit SecG